MFKNLPKQEGTGYATFGSAQAGGAQVAQEYGQQYGAPEQFQQTTQRAMTIDDVVTKTAITLGVLTISAIVSYFLVDGNTNLAAPSSSAADSSASCW